MYKHHNTDVCVISYKVGNHFPLLCLTFDNYTFIEWIGNNSILNLVPQNMNIIEYMNQNNNNNKIKKSLENPTFSSGGCDYSLKMIEEFKNYLF